MRLARSFLAAILLCLMFGLTVPKMAMGQSRPSSSSALAEDSLESRPIARGIHDPSTEKTSQVAAPAAAFDFTRVFLALGGVIGLIFLLRAGAKRFFPGAISHRAASAVKVLGRCSISPRQHLLVIQFGKRLLLVGDSGSHLNPLCEITDAEEVSAILSQARDESISTARRFDSLFGRARKGFADTNASDDQIDPAISSAESEVSQDRFDASHEIVDPSIEATKKELAGLSNRVRNLAREIGRA